MEDQKQYVSKEKLEELKTELDRLKNVDRREVAEHLEYAKSLGDLSENAEYHEAREQQADIEDRIQQIEDVLKNAVLINVKDVQSIQVGSRVVVKKEGGKEEEYTIVGSEETDVLHGKISYVSPIGSCLLGKKKGDKITVATPRGEIKYSIIDIK